VLRPVRGQGPGGEDFRGYEMHLGRTTGEGLAQPFLTIAGEGPHGAVSASGRVMGCYVHGLFEAGGLRAAMLRKLGAPSTGADHGQVIDDALDEIADVLDRSLDLAALARTAGLPAT
jgi:adenosylcobyric acid synthase